MEIRKLKAEDRDELLAFLNRVFANKYGRDMDFLCEQPKMWECSDDAMGKHIAIFDGGQMASVVGIYPLPVVIGEEKLLFATTGNVATSTEYEGRGFFTKLFAMAMQEIEELGVDVARLGGARQRYARFGFEPSGSSYSFELNSDNVSKYFGGYGENVEFERVKEDCIEKLEYISDLIRKKDFYVKRSADNGHKDLYALLGTKHSAPYVAKKDGTYIGYICAACDRQFVGVGEFGRNVTEYGYESSEDFLHMICAYQRKVGKTLSVTVAPHETELLEKLSDGAEYATLTSPSRFKVRNFEKLTNALIKLKDKKEPLPIGESVVEIEDYGKLLLFKNGEEAGASFTEKTADTKLTKAEATRLLFGHLPYFATKKVPENLKPFLPLPLSWNTLDYV